MKKLEDEERRGPAEGLDEERLALYDILVTGAPGLPAAERGAVKKLAADLPEKIQKKLVIDWRKNQRSRAAVKVAIKSALDDCPARTTTFSKTWSKRFTSTFSSHIGARVTASTSPPNR